MGKDNKDKYSDKDQEKSNDDQENVSFFNLFRYATKSEKIMIFISVICSILYGFAVPLTTESLGKIVNIFVSLVVNTTVKNITGIEDEAILEEITQSHDNLNNPVLTEYSNKYSDINLNNTLKSLSTSEYANYDFNSDFKFKPQNEIFKDLYKQMIILLIIGLVSFICTYLYNSLFNISAYRQVTKIRSLAFKSILRQDIPWHEQTSPGELSSRIVSDTILIEGGLGVKLGMIIQNFTQVILCYALAFKHGWKLALGI